MKIGMYTEDEIFEYLTDGEGSFLGRSMYDAIFDKIHALTTENEQLKQDKKFYQDAFVNLRDRNDSSITWVNDWKYGYNDWFEEDAKPSELLKILRGESHE